MQTSNDSFIFQLTNIGAAQRESPLRTPRKLPTQIEEPITPPPSSKGKRWAERLTSFPRSGERRKKSAGSPSTDKNTTIAHSIAISPPMASGRAKMGPKTSEPDLQYPSRTDSLPRPTLNLTNVRSRDGSFQGSTSPFNGEVSRRLPPPRALTFGYDDARASPKKSFLNCVCTVCDEPIFTRTHGERIIELECGHISHQECLLVSLEASQEIETDEFLDAFPRCSKCQEIGVKNVKCLPKNHDLKDKLISEFLINKNLGSPGGIRRRKASQVHPGLQSFSSSPAVTTTRLRQGLMPAISRSARSAFQVPLVSDRSPRRRLFPSGSHSDQISKGSPFAASSSIVSSANDLSSTISADVSLMSKSNKGPLERTQLPILRAYFMEILLANFKNRIVDWQFDAAYGLLRLVDKLFVSSDGSTYSTCLCYLFEKALVVTTLLNENPENVLDSELTNLQIFAPIFGVKVEAVESSTFKCSIPSDAGHQELFLTENPNADTSQIIQKWISGLLNHDFTFDESNFTSTLPVPPIIRQLKGRADRGSFFGMVGSSKIIELTGLDQLTDSIIVRRGVKIPLAGTGGTDNLETIETVMTTISSILSLKREKPNDLVLVLQCNFEDPSFTNSLLTTHNSIKALNIKFPDLKVCVVDAEGYVLSRGAAKDLSLSPENISSFKQGSDSNKFSPEWLKEAFYTNLSLDNVGIAIISGTSMEVGKSCLLMDYKPFTCIGRSRPNELKVKVGYLNVDYSDSIEELVEVAAWVNILEALTYSFSLMFGDDEDEEISGDDCSTTDTALLEESDSMSSITNLEFNPTDTLALAPSDEEGSLEVVEKCRESEFLNLEDGIETSKPGGTAQTESLSAKQLEKGWDPLFHDIESAIRELQRGGSASPGRQSGHFYTYM